MGPAAPLVSVVVDGDPRRVYRPGDKVTGKVYFVAEKQEHIKSLKLNFAGVCITTTSRQCYVAGNDGDDSVSSSRRTYKAEAPLFNYEKVLMSGFTVAANKCSWSFEFTFPELTQARHSRWVHGSNYMKDIHQLPPSFHIYTNEPGGEAMIKYYIEAKLTRAGSKPNKASTHTLLFNNSARQSLPEPRLRSHQLAQQTWKSTNLRLEKHTLTQKISHVITRNPELRTPCIRLVPTLHCPETVTPGQRIPLSLSLKQIRRSPVDPESPRCTLDRLTVTISTYTRAICGGLACQPQDIVAKHRTCISRCDINLPITLDDTSVDLTHNFRLDDNAESIPAFKTYTISRSYILTAEICIICHGKHFQISSSTPLGILPRIPDLYHRDHDELVDPLPLYTPRPPLPEHAPEYRDSMATAYTVSTVPSTLYSDDRGTDSDGYVWTQAPTPFTPPMTPELEEFTGGQDESATSTRPGARLPERRISVVRRITPPKRGQVRLEDTQLRDLEGH
ncbi:hypothetical protein K432DRAFT_255633, partial [Lepidopterella palustris CBS 459.81]